MRGRSTGPDAAAQQGPGAPCAKLYCRVFGGPDSVAANFEVAMGACCDLIPSCKLLRETYALLREA